MAAVIQDRERALLRTFQSAFLALDDFRSKNPEAATRVGEIIAAHLRASMPQVFAVAEVRHG
jgi:hypothetical protein